MLRFVISVDRQSFQIGVIDIAGNVIAVKDRAIEAFDQISDEIAATIDNRQPDPNHVHRFLIQRSRDGIVAYEKMQMITADELEKLPKDQRQLVKSYEKSMQKLKNEWHKLKRGDVDAQLDPQTRAKNLKLIESMKDNLVGILDFLEKQNIYLDDHYIDVRALVSQMKPEGVAQAEWCWNSALVVYKIWTELKIKVHNEFNK